MELVIEKGIVIDKAENVGKEIQELTGKRIRDLEILKKFVTREKATKYYIDEKLNSKMVRDDNSILLWLDTGYVDRNGNTVFVSLHKLGDGFSGHITGTLRTLTNDLKRMYNKNRRMIDDNYTKFIKKYRNKIEERDIKHIFDEQEYFVSACNQSIDSESINTLGHIIENLHIDFSKEVVEEIVEVLQEEVPYEINANQNEITISFLYDELEKAQALINEQWQMIKVLEAEKLNISNDSNEKEERYKDQINELELKIKEREKAMVQMRTFGIEEMNRIENSENKEDEEMFGHCLLNHNRKLLVLGATKIDTKTMLAVLSKEFGFEKTDIDFLTDYNKLKSYGSGISNKYDAVILGACPHKVKKMGDWNSAVEKILADEFIPAVADARMKNNTLGVTKCSFRQAVSTVVTKLKNRAA